MQKIGFFLALVTICLCAPSCLAESLSCVGPADHVVIEAGSLNPNNLNLSYPRALEPLELAFDANQEPVLTEWVVNLDAFTMYAVAHCYREGDKTEVESIAIPKNIKRCLLDRGTFTCESGTMACSSCAIERVVIEKWRRGERVKEKHPFVMKAKEGEIVASDIPQSKDPEVELLALCSQRPSPWTPDVIDIQAIPRGMKHCMLADGRFICTEDQGKQGAFWSKTSGCK